ncbi:membrane protein [Salinimicrobium marinum]|uniref:Membrane protein n=1 Tax=Salinimicrobium marinum TaxID=680283 RepID=A0A918W1I1_9FLAO|nr:DUF423 domain-containing protein [Salinimicrobium marinum]GHA44753.1 membrane protein [Salinimicrobium marinum]
MKKEVLITGVIFGLIAIILGAFAAHGLKPHLTPDQRITFETGVKYQMYSGLFLLFLGIVNGISERVKKICFYLTLFGVILFSGSIFLLATNSLTSFDFTVIALITPLGGTLMIAAWIVLLVSFFKLKKK